MKNLFTTILIVILCLTLTVNFIRVTVSGSFFDYDPTTVKTMSYRAIIQDFAAISEDTSVLFRNMSSITVSFLDFLSEVQKELKFFLSFQEPKSATIIVDFFSLLWNGLKGFSKVLLTICVGIFNIGNFVVNLLRDVINILNHLLGFDLPVPSVGGQGASGGGFGGRR